MVTIRILCVGKLKEKYWQDACNEYAKRLRPFCRFEIVELPEHRLPSDPSEAEIQAGLEAEGRRILEVAGSAACIPLCILCAWVLYRMGQIRVVHLPQGGDR